MPRSSAGTEAFTGPDALSTAHDLRAANLFCARLARGHYENFPVASRREPALLEYCRLSANPVGRLLLRLFGYGQETLTPASDAICTALQLANHWQDVTIDLRRGRVYLPEDALKRFGVTESDLRSGRATESFRALMRDRVARTRALFAAGRPLCDAVRGRFRWELRLIWLGGQRILDRTEAASYDGLSTPPRLAPLDT